MNKSEKPCLLLDEEDAFGHYEDPDWVKQMLAANRRYFAQSVTPEDSAPAKEVKPAS